MKKRIDNIRAELLLFLSRMVSFLIIRSDYESGVTDNR